MPQIQGSNTLISDLKCPKCKTPVTSGVGFRAGLVNSLSYKIGDKLEWQGKPCWPEERPSGGNFKTIGYFDCENLNCPTWQDCFPEIQEVLISVHSDYITKIENFEYKPGEQNFDIILDEDEAS